MKQTVASALDVPVPPQPRTRPSSRDRATPHQLLVLGIDIADVVADIRQLAGVVETGFFPTEASEALIATASGVRRMTRQ